MCAYPLDHRGWLSPFKDSCTNGVLGKLNLPTGKSDYCGCFKTKHFHGQASVVIAGGREANQPAKALIVVT